MIGSSFPAVLTIEDDGEQFIEKHSVRVDAVPDQPAKVCFVFKRDGVWRSLIMRAAQAVKLLPTRVHLMSAPFLSSRAMAIIKKLPLSGNAEDEMVICCEEVLHLMDSIGFETGPVLQGSLSNQEFDAYLQ